MGESPLSCSFDGSHSGIFRWQMGWNGRSKTIPVMGCFIGNGRRLNSAPIINQILYRWPLQHATTSMYGVPHSLNSKGSSCHLSMGGVKRMCGLGLKMPKLG